MVSFLLRCFVGLAVYLAWTAQAQFTFHDLPYMVPVTATFNSPVTPPTNGLIFWWHAADLPDGPVAAWTDRWSGFNVVLTQSTAIYQPTKSGNYITFSSTNAALGSSNSFPDFYGPYGVAVIAEHKGGINEWLVGYDNGGTYPFGLSWVVSGTTISLYNAGNHTIAPGVSGLFDLLYYCTNTSYKDHTYTNGLLSKYNAGGMQYWPAPLRVGSKIDNTKGFVGDVYDILFYSNAILSLDTASNLHRYRTNVYY